MPGFAAVEGLLLLLLVPLVALLQRRRARPRSLVLTLLPYLGEALRRREEPVPRAFRLGPRQRALLRAATVASLALGAAGLHWVTDRPPPGEWLVVLDNPYTLAAPVTGTTPLDALRAGVPALLARVPERDHVTAVATSPDPEVFFRGTPQAAAGAIGERLVPSASAPPPEDAAEFLADAFGAVEWRGRVVLTPRPGAWREALAARGEEALYVVPSGAEGGGNAGIVSFEAGLSASAQGLWDLRFTVASRGLGAAALPVALRAGPDVVRRERVDLDASGEARVAWEGLALPDGPVVLALEAADAFAPDDAVAATLRRPAPVTVALPPRDLPFLAAAVAASEELSRAAEGGEAGAAVEVVAGAAPAELRRPTLLVTPVAEFLGFRFRAYRDAPGEAAFHPFHPVTRSVRFENLRPARVLEFELPPGFEAVGRAGPAPLVAVGEHGGARLVVWNFDPVETGAFLDPSFPILTRESLLWLAGEAPAAWERLDAEGVPARNVLSREVTAAAARLAVPDLSAALPPARGAAAASIVDLTWPCAAVGLALLVYGALVNAYGPRSR